MTNRFPPPPEALRQGLRMVLPGPDPVSPPAAPYPPRPPVGDMGKEYGIQQFGRWAAGDVTPKQLIDVRRADLLWRISCFGPVVFTLAYGTTKKREIADLQSPLIITVPGQLSLTATPLAHPDSDVSCIVTLTEASAGALSNARKYTDTVGALDAGAVRFVALEATSLNVAGQVVVLATSQFVPLVAGSVLVSGSGFQEFEA
jgi:hypothetical protein